MSKLNELLDTVSLLTCKPPKAISLVPDDPGAVWRLGDATSDFEGDGTIEEPAKKSGLDTDV